MRGRFTDARRQLGGLTREVQRLSRLLDEVPSQSELLQYERRFAELGEQVRGSPLRFPLPACLSSHGHDAALQVSEKLDETRKYFTLYNMLDRKRRTLLALLNRMVARPPPCVFSQSISPSRTLC